MPPDISAVGKDRVRSRWCAHIETRAHRSLLKFDEFLSRTEERHSNMIYSYLTASIIVSTMVVWKRSHEKNVVPINGNRGFQEGVDRYIVQRDITQISFTTALHTILNVQ